MPGGDPMAIRRDLRSVSTGTSIGTVTLDTDTGAVAFAGEAERILRAAFLATDIERALADRWSDGVLYLDSPTETDVSRAAGHDTTPGHDQLHHFWTKGKGLAKWVLSPKPWTTLVAHLTKYVGALKAKVYASRWFIEVFGFAAGSDMNRVMHGHAPRGKRVGPG